MSVYYNGEHSITFADADSSSSLINRKNTWEHFYMIPSSSLSTSIYTPRVFLIDMPFSSRTIDFTPEILKEEIFYRGSMRGQWEFYIDHNRWTNWYTAKKEIETYFNGKRLKCLLEDDPDIVYKGRFYITNWSDEANYSKVTIDYYIDESNIDDRRIW